MAPQNEKRVVIKSTDMVEDMQRDAVEIAKHVSARPRRGRLAPCSHLLSGSRDLFLAHDLTKRSALRSSSHPPSAAEPPAPLTRPLSLPLQANDKWTVEKDVAAYVKKEFDTRYGPTWHCIVGRNFGSYVTHETKHFIYLYVDHTAVLLFKSG